MLAHPLETVAAGPGAIERIAEIARTRKIEAVIIGLPKMMSGEHGAAADEVVKFVEQLRKQIECPVRTWDERLTSVAAQRALHESGKNTRQMRPIIDQVAAQMILQGYLDSRAPQQP